MTYGIPRGIRFQILSESDLQRIHTGTLHVLETVGVQVESEASRRLLRENGAVVDDRTRIARFPASLVEEALR